LIYTKNIDTNNDGDGCDREKGNKTMSKESKESFNLLDLDRQEEEKYGMTPSNLDCQEEGEVS
jgi:hypothetical protein